MKCNQSRPGFELELPCPFPTTITITPRAPLKSERNSHDWSSNSFTSRSQPSFESALFVDKIREIRSVQDQKASHFFHNRFYAQVFDSLTPTKSLRKLSPHVGLNTTTVIILCTLWTTILILVAIPTTFWLLYSLQVPFVVLCNLSGILPTSYK